MSKSNSMISGTVEHALADAIVTIGEGNMSLGLRLVIEKYKTYIMKEAKSKKKKFKRDDASGRR